MKAVRLHEYKRPPSVDEVPQPDLESHDDVLVRVGGAGVCRTDLHLIDGWFADVMPADVPFTLGHETAGWVEAVGRNVSNLEVGDPVIVHPLKTCGICWGCRHGEDMYCASSAFPGVNTDGGYAEYLRTGSRSLIALPDGIEPADVAPHADAGLTAYRAVRKAKAILQAGESIAVFGAGGLGHIGVQLLKAMTPAKVIVIDPSPAARELAASVGADVTLDVNGAAETVLEATGGRGADVVLDFVGENGTPALAIEIVRQGGTYLIVGYGGELQVPTMLLILKEATIIGNLVGSYGDLSELIALAAAGHVELHTVQYDLEAAPQALDDLDNGRVNGRAVLIPSAH